MNKKSIITVILLVCILILTNTTCEMLNKDMKLTLPSYLFDGDTNMSRGNGIIQLYDYMGTEVIVELTIVPANADNPENVNNDTDDLSKFLLIPPYSSIPEDQLFIEFECKAIDTVMAAPYYKDVTVRASALHFNNAQDTVRIHDVAAGPTPVPTEVATPEPSITPEPTVTPEITPEKPVILWP